MLNRLLCTLFALLAPLPLRAQEIAATGAERELSHARSWRLLYENDFFAATDRYFTQGIYLEFVHPAIARSLLRHVLITPSRHPTRFGVAFGDEGYTGSDLKRSEIVPGDHPWAGTKQLHAFAISTDTLRHRRLSSHVAERVGVSRQNMRKLMLTHADSFPLPVHEGSAAVWHLADVLDWLQVRMGYVVNTDLLQIARVALQVNVARERTRITRAGEREFAILLG